MANWKNDVDTYTTLHEKEADDIYLYGAGPIFEVLMYKLDFVKLDCDKLLEIVREQSI